MSGIVKGIVKGVKKIVKGLAKVVKKIAKPLAIAALIYFGVPLVAGAFAGTTASAAFATAGSWWGNALGFASAAPSAASQFAVSNAAQGVSGLTASLGTAEASTLGSAGFDLMGFGASTSAGSVATGATTFAGAASQLPSIAGGSSMGSGLINQSGGPFGGDANIQATQNPSISNSPSGPSADKSMWDKLKDFALSPQGLLLGGNIASSIGAAQTQYDIALMNRDRPGAFYGYSSGTGPGETAGHGSNPYYSHFAPATPGIPAPNAVTPDQGLLISVPSPAPVQGFTTDEFLEMG